MVKIKFKLFFIVLIILLYFLNIKLVIIGNNYVEI